MRRFSFVLVLCLAAPGCASRTIAPLPAVSPSLFALAPAYQAPPARRVAGINAGHHYGDMLVYGGWDLNPAALRKQYNGLTPNRFGTFEELIPQPDGSVGPATEPDGRPFFLRETHYRLFRTGTAFADYGKFARGVGLRPVPVVDGHYDDPASAPRQLSGKNEDGEAQEVVGSEEVDSLLRREFGYGQKGGPLYALITYSHPGDFQGGFDQLGGMLKTENGITHMGAYIGQGSTRNSPASYHDFTWQVGGYPALLFGVFYDFRHLAPTLHKASDVFRIFNQNAITSLQLLNELNGGPRFPGDYKFDYYRTISLKETLAFFRRWLENDPKLTEDPKYDTYCAEHITITTNIALNVPQNLKGYQAIWGQENGGRLFDLARKRWKSERSANGHDIKAPGEMPETDARFVPLYKMHEIENPADYEPADQASFGRGLAWPAETTADLLRDYESQYANFVYVGPVLSTAAILSFAEEAKRRMGVPVPEYLSLATPVAANMFVYSTMAVLAARPEADREGAFLALLPRYQAGLKQVLQKMGPPGELLAGAILEPLSSPEIKQKIFAGARELSGIGDPEHRFDTVRAHFAESVKPYLEKARAVPPALSLDDPANTGSQKNVQYYSPPSVVLRVVYGIHDHDPFLRFLPLATVMQADELMPMAKKYLIDNPHASKDSKWAHEPGRLYDPYKEWQVEKTQ